MSGTDGAPLRVAIFAESYLPYLSGVTVSTEALARGLGEAGHQLLLLAPRPAGGVEPGTAGARGPEPRVAWLPSFGLPRPAPPGYRVPWPVPSAALREALAFRPQVVHAQSPFISGLMARRLARRLGVPLVFTHHTRFGDYRHYLGALAAPGAWALSAYLGRFWSGCAAVIAPGSELGREIEERLGRGHRPQVRVIPTGIDAAAIAALPEGHPRRESGWPMDSLVVVSLGRVAPEKNVALLVEAFAGAAAEHPRLRLLLVGGGPATESVAAQAAALGLSDRVRVTGMLPRHAALELVRAADLFAFASRTETQGLVLAEALAAGLPVVALEGPGVRDSVRDGVDGVVVASQPPDSAAERLGAAIGSLAADPAARTRLAHDAAEGAARFDVAARVSEVVALYRELLGRRG